MNTYVTKCTPCIRQLKFLHIVEQCIVPPFAASTTRVGIGWARHCSLLANTLLRKLCVLPESIRMYKGCLSTFPATLKVWQPIVPSRALREIWGVSKSYSITFASPSMFPISSSSSSIHREYRRLFLQRWPGTNRSSHQKQSPLALLSSRSRGRIVLVGLCVGVGKMPCCGCLKVVIFGATVCLEYGIRVFCLKGTKGGMHWGVYLGSVWCDYGCDRL